MYIGFAMFWNMFKYCCKLLVRLWDIYITFKSTNHNHILIDYNSNATDMISLIIYNFIQNTLFTNVKVMKIKIKINMQQICSRGGNSTDII